MLCTLHAILLRGQPLTSTQSELTDLMTGVQPHAKNQATQAGE
jgi:hypothetical protein